MTIDHLAVKAYRRELMRLKRELLGTDAYPRRSYNPKSGRAWRKVEVHHIVAMDPTQR